VPQRAVLEAVTTKLCGGLRVGVLLHGKQIRDDSRTLLHSGLSQNDSMNAIEFMLEPNAPAQIPPSICHKDPPPAPLSCDSPKFVNRYLVVRFHSFSSGVNSALIFDANVNLLFSGAKFTQKMKCFTSRHLINLPQLILAVLLEVAGT